jgi:hypothetical protein
VQIVWGNLCDARGLRRVAIGLMGKRECLGQQREEKVERELVQEVHARETLEREEQARFGLGARLVSMGDEKPVSRCSTRVLNRSKPSACTIFHALRAYEI